MVHSSPARRRRNVYRSSKHCLVKLLKLAIGGGAGYSCVTRTGNVTADADAPLLEHLLSEGTFSVRRTGERGYVVRVPPHGGGRNIFRSIQDFIEFNEILKTAYPHLPMLSAQECAQVDRSGGMLTNILNDLLQTAHLVDRKSGSRYLQDFLCEAWESSAQSLTWNPSALHLEASCNISSNGTPGRSDSDSVVLDSSPVSERIEVLASGAPSLIPNGLAFGFAFSAAADGGGVWLEIQNALREMLNAAEVDCMSYISSWMQQAPCGEARKQRDIFPLPPFPQWPPECDRGEVPQELALLFTNCSCGALNYLSGNFKRSRIEKEKFSAPSKAQASVHSHVAKRCVVFLQRLADVDGEHFRWKGSFQKFEPELSVERLQLKADQVDLLDEAATCDPALLVDDGLLKQISDPVALFTHDLSNTIDCNMLQGKEREEYLLLVVRQLQCGKVRLRHAVRAVGDVFVVPKSAKDHQREVWNGSRISRAAERPPAPTMLANPSCFIDVQVEAGEQLYFSKRDVHTCFDIIKAPSELQEWFGRPPVTAAEVMRVGGFGKQALQEMIDDGVDPNLGDASLLYPVSTVMPMGFSWSSAIAQSCTVSCCLRARVDPNSFMCMEKPMPLEQDELCGVATDDTIFIHKDRGGALGRLTLLDRALLEAGMPKNGSKDVDAEGSMVALGCELTSKPPSVEAERTKMAKLFSGFIDIVVHPVASPIGINGALGLGQWFALLQRPLYSVFNDVYAFVRRTPANRPTRLPAKVRIELGMASFLFPFAGADLSRDFVPFITCCDASPDFGFGVSALQVETSVCRKLGRLAERRGDYIRLYTQPGDPELKSRIGEPHFLPYRQSQFKTIICKRAAWKGHSGLLEAHALLLALKWIVRKSSNHGHRLPVLLDAKAVLGAAAKGRTSAPAFRGVLRHIAALCMGTNSLLRLVYIPSESNPADLPSRGRRYRVHPSRRVVKRNLKSRVGTISERRWDRFGYHSL